MNNKTAFIYVLIDPRNELIRYVGKTNNIRLRFNSHISDVKRHKSYKNNWLKKLFSLGLIPKMEIIDEVSVFEWEFWEQHYISLYKSWGFRLTNGTLGGDSGPSSKGRIVSKETREKLRQAQLRRPKEVLEKARKALLENSYKISLKLKGKKKPVVSQFGFF